MSHGRAGTDSLTFLNFFLTTPSRDFCWNEATGNGAIHLTVPTLWKRWAMGLILSNSAREDDVCRRNLSLEGGLMSKDLNQCGRCSMTRKSLNG